MSTRFEKLYAENVNKNIKLNVKPSTELIPDEYHVPFDGKECVHIFVADKDLVIECEQFLKDLNIQVRNENIHNLDGYNMVSQTLQEVAVFEEEPSMLLMLFWGYSKNDGEFTLEDDSALPFHKIWSIFSTSSFRNFMDKPKVFLFNVIKSVKLNQRDGTVYVEPLSPYEVPNGADLLIIYKHNLEKEESIVFIQELADVLRQYGKIEDLCSVVTIIDTKPYTRPVIISTMLKKLYLLPSQLRGHYLHMELNHQLTLETMKQIDAILTDARKDKEKSPSFIIKMKKRISSFRKTSSINESPKEDDKNDDSSIKITKNTKNPNQSLPVPSASAAGIRKLSKDTPGKLSVDKLAPRPSAERSARRPSVGKLPGKKFSLEEKKPWKP